MDYETLASQETVDKVVRGLAERGVEALVVGSGAEALASIKELIPPGASVTNGSSRTLEQIGFVEHLKAGGHGWNNLHEAIVKEKDPARQAALRKEALLSEYYLGSVHALAETGEFLIASNTGSQLPHVVYSSQNPILVVSTKKIVPTLSDAFQRLDEHVVPLEDENMRQKYGMGTMVSKILVFKHENAFTGRRVRMILVSENLGF